MSTRTAIVWHIEGVKHDRVERIGWDAENSTTTATCFPECCCQKQEEKE